jgi:hypothetical protein
MIRQQWLCVTAWAPLLVAGIVATPAAAADLKAVDRTIRKEPAYRTKSPRYALLVFGPEARDRVWLVHDGDTLYVDRNGNCDLTDAGEAVPAKKGRDPDEFGYQFEVGELRVGGRIHQGLGVGATPLALYPDEVKNLPGPKAALASEPKACAYGVCLDVDWPGLRGSGAGGRVMQGTKGADDSGVLLFAARPADAPVIHFGGPLRVTFDGARPTLKLERDNDVAVVVGTPGLGAGTFAKIAYEGTVPESAVPRLEILFPPAKAGDSPLRELFELRERC